MTDKSIDKKILELLKKSSISAVMKDMIKNKLPHLVESAKMKVLEALTNEQKKLQSLAKKKERIVAKYAQLMERVGK